jgi:hypothetical protein
MHALTFSTNLTGHDQLLRHGSAFNQTPFNQ